MYMYMQLFVSTLSLSPSLSHTPHTHTHTSKANRYLAVHSSTPRSANLGETVNITFVFVEAVGEFVLDLLKDGDVIARSFNGLREDGQFWYYELTVNSSSGGNYTLDDGSKTICTHTHTYNCHFTMHTHGHVLTDMYRAVARPES